MPEPWNLSTGDKEPGSKPLLIVGASVRAAAQSAARAGRRSWLVDLFADRDTQACGPCRRVPEYPHGIVAALENAPAGEWMYTGALENWPEIIDELAGRRPLLGIGGEGLRCVRDPLELHRALQAAGFAAPAVALTVDGLPSDGNWLCKPLRSAGGRGVSPWRGEPTAHREVYFQRRISGELASAVFVGSGDDASLLGITHQLAGRQWAGAAEFQYCGSIGPLRVNSAQHDRIAKLGQTLAAQFGLAGLFGVDFMLADNEAWPLEVNPRYTASVEILERGLNCNAIALHLAGCRRQPLPAVASESGLIWGKAIVYAKQDLTVSDALSDAWWSALGDYWPWLADLSPAGTPIERGQPVLTVFRVGGSPASVERELHTACEEIYDQIRMSPVALNAGA